MLPSTNRRSSLVGACKCCKSESYGSIPDKSEKKKKIFVFHINEFHLQEKGLSRIKRNVSMC